MPSLPWASLASGEVSISLEHDAALAVTGVSVVNSSALNVLITLGPREFSVPPGVTMAGKAPPNTKLVSGADGFLSCPVRFAARAV